MNLWSGTDLPTSALRFLFWARMLIMFLPCQVDCDDPDLRNDLLKLDDRLSFMSKKVNRKNIDYFVFSGKLNDLQVKIGNYQDEDRRLIVQINGMPKIDASLLYRVLEGLADTLNVTIRDEDITMLHAMTQYTSDIYAKQGRKVFPIIMGLKTRKIKWRWMQGLRQYLHKYKQDYKKNGMTIRLTLDGGKEFYYSGVTIHEHLSPVKRKLFKEVKKRCTDMDYQDMWFNDTEIYVKKRGYHAPIKIRNLEDMYKKITKSHWSRDNLLFRYDARNIFNYDHDNV